MLLKQTVWPTSFSAEDGTEMLEILYINKELLQMDTHTPIIPFSKAIWGLFEGFECSTNTLLV